MRILGIDPGTEATGYGVIDSDGDRHLLLDYGVISLPRALSFSEKLRLIHIRLLEVIGRHRPDGVVVEDLFYASNVKSALRLGHVRGVTLLAGVLNGLAIHEYSPLEVKQAVVGYGRAAKEQVQKMVMLLLRLESPPEPDDAADALAVALCHAHRLRFSEKAGAGRMRIPEPAPRSLPAGARGPSGGKGERSPGEPQSRDGSRPPPSEVSRKSGRGRVGGARKEDGEAGRRKAVVSGRRRP